jgi:hypothetical protein
MSRYRDDDQPDYPEPPECCDEIMDVSEDGTCKCAACGKTIDLAPEWDPSPEPDLEEIPDDDYEGPPRCPHDDERGSCDACDFLGDIAYDAARESRYR